MRPFRLDPPVDGTLDFGEVVVGESLTLELRLTASGGSLRVESFAIDGNTLDDFAVECPEAPLYLGGGCPLLVTFTPALPAGRLAALEITVALAGRAATYEVLLTAVGVDPP